MFQMFPDVLGCSQTFSDAPRCSQMFSDVPCAVLMLLSQYQLLCQNLLHGPQVCCWFHPNLQMIQKWFQLRPSNEP